MFEHYEEKVLFLEPIQNFLLENGISINLSNILIFIIALIILSLLILLINTIGAKILLFFVKFTVRRTKTQWDELLLKHHFYSRLVKFGVAIVIMATTPILFQGFSNRVLYLADIILSIYLIYTGLQVFNALSNTTTDIYESKLHSGRKSIRNIIQATNIVATVIASILIISILLNQNPRDLLVALGASAAIISLVFRDVILGFVASVQISSQEMLRPGDWIQMPSKEVNGTVLEINVLNVKVRNRDNSVVTIPTYSLLADSFTNWQPMLESEGRLFKRPLLIDVNCIKIMSQEEIGKILSNTYIKETISLEIKQLLKKTENDIITNLTLFRYYIETMIEQNPRIVKEQIKVVRYLDNSQFGITMQLYAYSKDKTLYDYEKVIAEIFENIMGIAPVFKIKLYQISNISETYSSDHFLDSNTHIKI